MVRVSENSHNHRRHSRLFHHWPNERWKSKCISVVEHNLHTIEELSLNDSNRFISGWNVAVSEVLFACIDRLETVAIHLGSKSTRYAVLP